MDIRASAARNWSRIHAVSGPHNRLDEQEPANANLAVDYRPAGMPLTLSANVNYRAGSSVRWSALVASSKAPARVLDLHAVWKLADGMRLRAGVLNLLGQDNVTRIHYSDGNIDTRTSVAFKASPTLRLGTELDLP